MNLDAMQGGLNGLDDMDGFGKKLKKLAKKSLNPVAHVKHVVKHTKKAANKTEHAIKKTAKLTKATLTPWKKSSQQVVKTQLKKDGQKIETAAKKYLPAAITVVASIVGTPAAGAALNAAWGAGRAVKEAKKADKKMNNVSGELEYYDERGNRISKAQFDQMEADYARAVAAEKAAKEAAQTKFVQTVNATNPQALTPEVKAEFAKTLASNGSGAGAAALAPAKPETKGVVAWAKENPGTATIGSLLSLKLLAGLLV